MCPERDKETRDSEQMFVQIFQNLKVSALILKNNYVFLLTQEKYLSNENFLSFDYFFKKECQDNFYLPTIFQVLFNLKYAQVTYSGVERSQLPQLMVFAYFLKTTMSEVRPCHF